MTTRKYILSATTAALVFISINVGAAPLFIGHDTGGHVVFVNGSALEDKSRSFVSNLSSEGIGLISDEALSLDQREKKFRVLLNKNFDMKTIGRFALGRYWKTSSQKQQKEYLDLFEDMIVRVYSKRFSDYNGEELDVVAARPEGKSDTLVSSVLVPQSGPKISIDWRVRQKKDGQLKIVDIIVEGVSMSLTQRSDFASVIQRGGGSIDVLLEHLRSSEHK